MNILHKGDALEYLSSIEDKSIDLVIMDPPYEVSVTNKGGTLNNLKNFRNTVKDVAPISEGYNYEILDTLMKKMKKANIYIWCNKKQIPRYFKYFVEERKCLFDILFWNKTNAMPSYNNKYLTDCEYLLYFKKKGAKNKPRDYEDAKTVYTAPINHKDKKKYGHPTIKPLDLTEKIIRNSSNEGDVVLDCFAGSGTTCVAAINTDRKYIGIEINDEYFEIAERRIEEALQNKE